MLTIQAPAAVIVEAKKADITTGLGQCVAEMVAAQLFNQEQNAPIDVIYGIVTNGMQWRFLMLEEKLITIDLMDYQLRPIDQLLAYLIWMVSPQAIDLNPLP
jgi:heterodisulfide reductase subunit B